MLVVKDITQTFGGLRALGGVSFTVAKGAIHSIIGPNGAGKTTLFNVLTGVYRPDAGSIRIEGREIRGRPPRPSHASASPAPSRTSASSAR